MANKSLKENDKNAGILNTSSINGLPVLSVSGFNNIHIKGNYYTTFRKIGDSILYIKSKGNLRDFYIERFNDLIEDFCDAAEIKKPYVQIRDLKSITGRMPLSTLVKQGHYYFDNQDYLIGSVTINTPSWMQVMINYGVSRFLPDMQFCIAESEQHAVNAAQKIISGDYGDYMNSQVDNPTGKVIYRKEDIIFKPDWEYLNPETGFRFKVGVISDKLIYVSLHGNLKKTNDVKGAFNVSKKAVQDCNIKDGLYVIADYSELSIGTSVYLKKMYAKEVKKISREYMNPEMMQFIIGAAPYNKIAIKLFSGFLKQKIFFEDSVDDALEKINSGNLKLISRNASDNSSQVSKAHIEEINDAFGSFLWYGEEENPEINVSPENPLIHFAETLKIIRCDLQEMRENERRSYKMLTTELEKAESIHRKIFPENSLELGDISIAAHYQPSTLLGGDSYNYFQSGDKLIIYMADVMGHGLDGAMLSFFIRETIDNYVHFKPNELSPEKMLKHLNEIYNKRYFSEEHIISIFISVLDLKTKELLYSSGGFHSQPLVRLGDGTKMNLNTGDLFIGNLIPSDLNLFKEEKLLLTKGTTILISTDGLYEQDNNGEIFQNKCTEIFYKLSGLPPKLIVGAINKEFCSYNNNSHKADDDIAFIVLQYDDKEKTFHHLEISSSFDELEPLNKKIVSITKNFPEQDTLRACLHEAVVNAIEHGNKNDPAKKVFIDLTVSDDLIIAEVEDEGEGFDWFWKIDKSINLDSLNDRGRGIAMTKKISGHFYYNNKGNKVTFLIR